MNREMHTGRAGGRGQKVALAVINIIFFFFFFLAVPHSMSILLSTRHETHIPHMGSMES